MAFAELYLTDGTARVNLLEANSRPFGIGVDKVRFSRPQRDTESVFSRRYKTVNETYSIKIVGPNMDQAIAYLRNLEGMLLQAENYFTGTVEMNPIWLVSRGRSETNPRYALVMAGQVPEYADIYQQPFLSRSNVAVIDDVDLGITRGAWLANPPTSPKDITSTLLSGLNAPRAVFVGNQYTEETVKSIKVFDASANSYVTYTSLPYPTATALLPAVPAAGDILYIGFGPKTYGSFAMPSGIFIDATAAGSNVTTAVWEYYNGAAWVAIPDIVDSWMKTFASTVVWSMIGIDNWAANAVNGVTLNWVRWRVTAVGAAPTPPTARQIVTLKNFVQINSSNVKGDVPALMDIRIESRQQGMSSQNRTYEIYMGLRTTSRGANFYPWLPPQQAAATPVVDSYQYIVTGEGFSAQPTTSWTTPVKFNCWGRTLDLVISSTKDYYGKFRAFLRVAYTGAETDFSMRLCQRDDSAFGSGNISSYGKQVYVIPNNGGSAEPSLYDMGIITIGGGSYATVAEKGGYMSLYLQVKADSATVDTMNVYDLFLLPIDEWSCHVVDPDPTTSGLWYNLVGSASFFKQQIRAITYDPSFPAQILRTLIVESSGPAILQPGKTQRLWFLFGQRLSTGQLICRYETSHQIYVKTQEMFLGFRGNG